MSNIKISNICKHFNLINKHRWLVFKLSIKAGIPWQGLTHDLSKYSPIEFWESAKYYQGNRSPIVFARKENVYSKAWLHHKGKNKHHEEYWYDWYAETKAPIIPYKYTVEMLCDNLAAGMTYNGKKWTQDMPIEYWEKKKEKALFHPKMLEFFNKILNQIKEQGIDAAITKTNLMKQYNKFCK